MNPITGVIHGDTIKLDSTPGIVDGARVEVVIRETTRRREPHPDFLAAAGALADYPEWDEIMDEIQARRRVSRPLPDDLE